MSLSIAPGKASMSAKENTQLPHGCEMSVRLRRSVWKKVRMSGQNKGCLDKINNVWTNLEPQNYRFMDKMMNLLNAYN